jgi:uncharacterized membrane protein YheB (UPF0754 family)
MYTVVKYNNYRKEQNFEIKLVTDDLEYAKKLAFNNAKKEILKRSDLSSSYKLSTDIQEYYLYPENKKIVQYIVVQVEKYEKNKLKISSTYSTVHAVLELPKHEKIESLEEIDDNLICNNYHSDYDSEDDDHHIEDN